MAHRGHRALFPIVLFAALPVFAQTADDRLGQLEKRLDALTQEVTQIRQEIDKLKGGAPAPSVPAATEDLTKVEVARQTAETRRRRYRCRDGQDFRGRYPRLHVAGAG